VTTRWDRWRSPGFYELTSEEMRAAVRLMLMAIMNEEHLWAHHTACQVRRGGITAYTCDLVTTVGKIKDLVVPRARGLSGRFRTQVFEQYQRCQRPSLQPLRVSAAVSWNIS